MREYNALRTLSSRLRSGACWAALVPAPSAGRRASVFACLGACGLTPALEEREGTAEQEEDGPDGDGGEGGGGEPSRRSAAAGLKDCYRWRIKRKSGNMKEGGWLVRWKKEGGTGQEMAMSDAQGGRGRREKVWEN
ncbi:hypothetical protein B0H19DRAFT_1227058 [Mycena capillaripes]|nr:hypothetical protein B0H19DRAFT_1227058 [Mycena capillaripes]